MTSLVKWRFVNGAGKANHELKRITHGPTRFTKRETVFVVSKDEVERLDYTRLFEFNPSARPENLCESRGNITFVVEGYDTINYELWEIPQVREFWARVNLHWPCWHFVANLHNNSFKMVASCVIKNVLAIKHDGHCNHDLFIDLDSLCRFFENGIPLTRAIQAKAGLSQMERLRQLRSVAKYLGIS